MSHCTSNITMTVLSTVYFSSFPEDIIMVYPNPFSCQVVRHYHVPLAFLHNALDIPSFPDEASPDAQLTLWYSCQIGEVFPVAPPAEQNLVHVREKVPLRTT